MSHIEEGRRGEEWGRDWLKRRGCKLFGPDWIVKENGGPPFIAEVKYQETYEAPLFDGHGLPVHQVEARMEFYEETGVPTLLLVNDKAKGRSLLPLAARPRSRRPLRHPGQSAPHLPPRQFQRGGTVTALDAALSTWSFLWDRRPALRCPNCGAVDTFLIRAADGAVCCPECK